MLTLQALEVLAAGRSLIGSTASAHAAGHRRHSLDEAASFERWFQSQRISRGFASWLEPRR